MSEPSNGGLAGEVYTETPLHYFHGSGAQGEQSGVIIREAPLKGHLVIRGSADSDTFREGISAVFGMALPMEPCTLVSAGESSLYWLGPTEWLAIVPSGEEAALAMQLRDVDPGRVSAVDVSGGQTLINLSGAGVQTLLMKSSSYDFHPANFGPGNCVQTTFAKATALVAGLENGSFDLVIRRSFADYLARWLLDCDASFSPCEPELAPD
ncbi:MAG: sarcosine oxidase, gamma subunit family protein [Halieaceae bacterium]|jgi:sarcosine oxidase, subunit gamma|nr:sarcosine oxidase, gamma subunit family protein [Halieaceae bacterium]